MEDTDVELQASVTVREGTGTKRAPDERLERGSSVGRYLILDVIGEGAMGVVYAAFDPELDRRVAVKLLQARPTAVAGSKGDQAWLVREAQALARLSHPNVIEVYDVGTLPGERVFVAMELVAGDTLRDWLKQPRAWRDVLSVLRGAGAGLAAAHAAGLVHRDFKPGNVLVVTDDQGREIPRIADFGLAIDPGDVSSRLTTGRIIFGSPAYMSPEQASQGELDARSDQFSLGVTLYELVSGRLPFGGSAIGRMRSRNSVSPSAVSPDEAPITSMILR